MMGSKLVRSALVAIGGAVVIACSSSSASPVESGDAGVAAETDGGPTGEDASVDAGLRHCGSCLPNEVCDGVLCKACAPNASACGDQCFELSKTDAHCGRCDVQCGLSEYCNAGRCIVATCSNGVQEPNETGVDCGGVCAPSNKCGTGSACVGDGDCASGKCQANKCVPGPCTGDANCGVMETCLQGTCIPAPISCAALKAAAASAPSAVYRIDPDGSGTAAPFEVFCDMTTDGGGWTVLPLRFGDGAMWSITQTGTACTTIAQKTNAGVFQQFFSATQGTTQNTVFKFVPPIAVAAVRLEQFNHSPSGACNSMDWMEAAVPSGATSNEGWYFADSDPATVRAYAFANDQSCTSPYIASNANCSRDSNLGAGFFTLTETIAYSAKAPLFQMVVVQGCQSGTCPTLSDGERFFVDVPPDQDGIWRKGILVR